MLVNNLVCQTTKTQESDMKLKTKTCITFSIGTSLMTLSFSTSTMSVR